jgi:hypothetical protein
MNLAGGLVGDRSREHGAGQFERAVDGQRFFAHAVVRSWGLSGAILLDPSLSGFDRSGRERSSRTEPGPAHRRGHRSRHALAEIAWAFRHQRV